MTDNNVLRARVSRIQDILGVCLPPWYELTVFRAI